ncbi:MAG: hypothetical protein HRF50_06485 [Phycisphaerae bacterium]|jgi:O-antigen/teichoic acid export membrane protein
MTGTAPGDRLEERAGRLQAAPRSLLHSAVYTVAGSGAFNLCRWLVVVLLVRYTSPDAVGWFDLAGVAIAAPIVLFFGLELRAAYVSDGRDEFPFGAYRALRRLGTGLAAAVTAGVILTAPLGATLTPLMILMLATGLGRALLNGQELYLGYYQRREALGRLAWSNVLRGVVMVIPFATILPLVHVLYRDGPSAKTALLWAAAAAAIIQDLGWLAVWLLYDRRWTERQPELDRSWTWRQMTALAWQTLPLGVVMLLINLCDSVPRWFIRASHGGATDLGYFAALKVISLGIGLFMMQVAIAGANRIVVFYHTDLSAFRRTAAALLLIAAGLGGGILAAAALFGRWFLETAYGPEYARNQADFVILIAAQAVSLLATVFGFLITQMRRFWIQVPIQIAVLAATTISAAVLVPDEPVRGGAWTALVRATVQSGLFLLCVLAALGGRDPQPGASQRLHNGPPPA